MIKKEIDPVFGAIEFKYLWKKNENLLLWGKEFPISIHVADLDEEGILPIQREAYQKSWPHISEFIESNKGTLLKYIQELAGVPLSKNIDDYLTPRSLLFERDGSWGVLFDCDFDLEHGVALIFKEESFQVSSQSDFI